MKKKYINTYVYETVNIEDQILLIPINSEKMDTRVLVLNELASEIWKLIIDAGYSVEEIIECLLKEYNVSYSELKKDVERNIGILVENNVIKPI